ncbi:hypothetical protein BH10ACI2_BH10ACI2_01310 [soil metagenome]
MDSYIGDELLIETNHDVLRHLENCRACRDEMAARRSLRESLRQTIKTSSASQIDPIFAARVSSELRDRALRPGFFERISGGNAFMGRALAATAFACVVLLAVGGFLVISRVAKNAEAVKLANAMKASWQEMTAQAVGDHENCAVAFHLKEDPVTLDQAAVSYGPFNKDLDKTVSDALHAVVKVNTPEDIKFLESHSCVFEGRRFAHIVFKQKGRLISVLVSDTDLPEGDDTIQTADFAGSLNAAGFHLGHHAVFVVSELPETDNAEMARKIAPAIRLHGEKVRA